MAERPLVHTNGRGVIAAVVALVAIIAGVYAIVDGELESMDRRLDEMRGWIRDVEDDHKASEDRERIQMQLLASDRERISQLENRASR